MKKIVRLQESDITNLVKKILSEQENERYMFFSNLQQIKRQFTNKLENLILSNCTEILFMLFDWILFLFKFF